MQQVTREAGLKMLELILGGARSGKSRFAEQQAAASKKQLVYVATARPGDGEMADRIQHHQARRSSQWQTIEEPIALASVLQKHAAEDVCILVDCLTLWLSNLLLMGDADLLDRERRALLKVIAGLPGHALLVSNSVGMGVVPMGKLSRDFVDLSGRLEQALARISDRVTFVVAGLPMVLKDTDNKR
jgi:adenosylcobinamide kinase/adenosylcobinamide-phosphate guanylyltransferase